MHHHTLHFGVSCHHGGTALTIGARQFADVLGKILGHTLHVAVAEDYDHLAECVLAGSVEVAWMPPLIAARTTAQGALLAAAARRGGAQTYRAAIVVRRDGPHESLDELVGTRAAWVDASSMSGYVFPRLYLMTAGLDPARALASETFHGTAQLACKAVAEGAADFAGCYVGESAGEDLAVAGAHVGRVVGGLAEKLRVIGITDSIPADAAVISPHVSAGDQHALRQALVSLHGESSGREALLQLLQAEELANPSPEYRASLDFLRKL